jgi:2-isopropylmalate synthase
MNCEGKYKKLYFMPPVECLDWAKKDDVDKAPIWCSVDLRDGNQALVEPMSLEEKLEFFRMLVKIGFKEIEVGFPAASETDYEFMRALIERNMIPDDVTVQVLTQAREHIIRKTFEAVKGAPKAVVHVYNSTSVPQREQVFRKSKEEIKQIAIDGAALLKKLADETPGNFSFEYSPESFTGTEVEYALEVCNAVIDVWQPTPDNKCIINLPATVEMAMPHVFASQIEYMSKNMNRRDSVVLSLHPHNDRGTGVADAELGLLAGADRIEGTIFGNGERTGNVDIVTIAMNMFSHGIDPKLDFSDITSIKEVYEKLTGMKVHERHPYGGALVFTAFSGSHQDAIAKGMKYREEGKDGGWWTIPYLPVDPHDVGREYGSDVIRINSQSGKGGVSYILEQNFGISLPNAMKEDFSYAVKNISDREHKELSPAWIRQIFEDRYLSHTPVFKITEMHFAQEDGITSKVTIEKGDKVGVATSKGNGRLDAVSNALKSYLNVTYRLTVYEERAMGQGSNTTAMSYVGLEKDGKVYWGAGTDDDIIVSSVRALCVAVNKILEE